ncbi:MAG: NmrA family NAD(P)-binding protein [Bacteroidales bacterium]
MAKKILITGATGNVGKKTIQSLIQKNGEFEVLAGVRNVQSKDDILLLPKIQAIHFDFEDEKSIHAALEQADILFLLRPPQLSDVKKYFEPLIRVAKEKNIQHIVFLSVQGAETSSMIPHHKIEKIIEESGINYTHLRPAYFMQNFTTTLKKNLVENDTIFLPAGSAKFTLIDLEDVGEVAAYVLENTSDHINKAYDLTNNEQLSFQQMADVLTQQLSRKIQFKSPNLLSFYYKKRKEKTPPMFILVMIMLHYLPRFKSTPPKSDWVEKITGKKPRSFEEFVKINKALLASH